MIKSSKISIRSGSNFTNSTSFNTSTGSRLSIMPPLVLLLFLIQPICPDSAHRLNVSLRRPIQAPLHPVTSLLQSISVWMLLPPLRLLLPLPFCRTPDLAQRDYVRQAHREVVRSPSSIALAGHLFPLWPPGIFHLVIVTITPAQLLDLISLVRL
jgi:hypothetical protein